jgi:hypothetical protein
MISVPFCAWLPGAKPNRCDNVDLDRHAAARSGTSPTALPPLYYCPSTSRVPSATAGLFAPGLCAPRLPTPGLRAEIGSSSISVQACAAFGGQDAELTTLSALRAQALRGRHGTGQQPLI